MQKMSNKYICTVQESLQLNNINNSGFVSWITRWNGIYTELLVQASANNDKFFYLTFIVNVLFWLLVLTY